MKSIKNPHIHVSNIFIKQFHTRILPNSCVQTVTVLYSPVQHVITIENMFHYNGEIVVCKYRYFRGTEDEARCFSRTLNWS